MANALTLMRHRFIADTLQRSLLAAEPVAPQGLEVAARCLPAAGQIVGGDWWDLVTLPAGSSGIIVGDVMGHGPEAAAAWRSSGPLRTPWPSSTWNPPNCSATWTR